MSKAYVIDKIDELDAVGVVSFWQGAGVDMQPFVFNATERGLEDIDGADIHGLFDDIFDWCDDHGVRPYYSTADELDADELEYAISFDKGRYMTENEFSVVRQPAVYDQNHPEDREALERIGFEIPDYEGIEGAFEQAGFARDEYDTGVCFADDDGHEISFETWDECVDWVQGDHYYFQDDFPEVQEKIDKAFAAYKHTSTIYGFINSLAQAKADKAGEVLTYEKIKSWEEEVLAEPGSSSGFLRDPDVMSGDPKLRQQMLAAMQADCEWYLACGGNHEFSMWSMDIGSEISDMRTLWMSLSPWDRPKDLSLEKIGQLGEQVFSAMVERGVATPEEYETFKREQYNEELCVKVPAYAVLRDYDLLGTGFGWRQDKLAEMALECRAYLNVDVSPVNEQDVFLSAAPAAEQINLMKALWDTLPDFEKGTCRVKLNDIEGYARRMGVDPYAPPQSLKEAYQWREQTTATPDYFDKVGDGFTIDDKSALQAVGVGYSFNLFSGDQLGDISLKETGQTVSVDGKEYSLLKAASYEESQLVDQLLDMHGEMPVTEHAVKKDEGAQADKGYSLGSQCAVASEAKDGQELGGSGPSGRDDR